jgi:hypothetical protein
MIRRITVEWVNDRAVGARRTNRADDTVSYERGGRQMTDSESDAPSLRVDENMVWAVCELIRACQFFADIANEQTTVYPNHREDNE